MRIGVIILSRMNSSRFPGKALKTVNNKYVLNYVIERAKLVKSIDNIIIATSNRDIDDEIEDIFSNNEIKIFRGDLNNVSLRFLECMNYYNLDAAIRMNGDSPLHNYQLINNILNKFQKKQPDIITNVYPRSYPVGMSVEIISRKAMQIACSKMKEQDDLEHVSRFFYTNSEYFKIKNVSQLPLDHSKVHLAVDTEYDFERFKWIINQLCSNYIDADYDTIIDLYRKYEK